MASWSPDNAPANFATHFATEEDRLIAKVAEGGSRALWMGVLLNTQSLLTTAKVAYGMNYSACMVLIRDICRTSTKFRMELHGVGFGTKKTRRADVQLRRCIKNSIEAYREREQALDTYISACGKVVKVICHLCMPRSHTTGLNFPNTKWVEFPLENAKKR
jgi:hypothetical protein